MLAKVTNKRRDSKSGFDCLMKYSLQFERVDSGSAFEIGTRLVQAARTMGKAIAIDIS